MSAASLYAKHANLAHAASRGYFVDGYDHDDLLQEARLALWHACRTYDPDRGAGFASFAYIVIRGHIHQLIVSSQRDRRRANHMCAELDDERLLHHVSDRPDVRPLLEEIARLPEFQRHCVVGIVRGLSYAEIGGPAKRIDNALYAARQTLRAAA